jgi:hypothetical protein
MWKNYIEKQMKNVLPKTHPLLQSEFIRQTIKADMKLKNRLLGILIGHFTADEFVFFSQNEAELTRRMTDLMIQRLTTF